MSTTLITVTRRWKTEKSTISSFSCTGGACSGYILEPKGPSTTKPNQRLRIPAGIYTLKWHNSPRFQCVLPELSNHEVSGDRHILLHAGNYPRNTDGCLLVGSTKTTDFVGSSRAKLDELLAFLGCYNLETGKFSLKIEENFE